MQIQENELFITTRLLTWYPFYTIKDYKFITFNSFMYERIVSRVTTSIIFFQTPHSRVKIETKKRIPTTRPWFIYRHVYVGLCSDRTRILSASVYITRQIVDPLTYDTNCNDRIEG